METPDLLMVCVSAFSAVFVLLGLLAVVMRLLIAAFPGLVARSDPAMLAAISATVSAVFPGTKITKVQEEK